MKTVIKQQKWFLANRGKSSNQYYSVRKNRKNKNNNEHYGNI
jgi:hypothetical protein